MIASAPADDLVQRGAWSLVWLGVLWSGLDAWGQWSAWPAMALVAPGLVALGLVGAALVWAARDPLGRWPQGLALGAAAVAATTTGAVSIAARRYYTTDSAALTHVATRLFVHGRDPYVGSLRAAAALLHPAPAYWTYLANGGHVARLSYPAGSILLQAPLALLGVDHLTTDWVDLAAWLATGVLLVLLLPRALRWLAPVLVLSGAFLTTFASGGTDALFVPFLVLALWRWDRAGVAAPSRAAAWVSPVALGVACSIKQSPWFVVPFVLVGVAVEARRAGRAPSRALARYAGAVAGAFTVVNLPFIVWNPAAWLHGTMLPLTAPLVPDGQGLVTLALHGLTGGATLRPLWVAAALVLVALVLALILEYPAMKRAWPFLVPLVLFVPGRSLSNYLLDFLPAALVAATSVAGVRPAPRRAPIGRRLGVVAAPLLGAAIAVGVALTSAPLALRVVHVTSSDDHQALVSVTVRVRNLTGASLAPHFMVSVDGGHPSGFWTVTSGAGALPLAAHARATVTLRAPGWFWAPPRDGYFLVTAYSSPSAVSTSPPQRWRYGPR